MASMRVKTAPRHHLREWGVDEGLPYDVPPYIPQNEELNDENI